MLPHRTARTLDRSCPIRREPAAYVCEGTRARRHRAADFCDSRKKVLTEFCRCRGDRGRPDRMYTSPGSHFPDFESLADIEISSVPGPGFVELSLRSSDSDPSN